MAHPARAGFGAPRTDARAQSIRTSYPQQPAAPQNILSAPAQSALNRFARRAMLTIENKCSPIEQQENGEDAMPGKLMALAVGAAGIWFAGAAFAVAQPADLN